MWDVVDLDDEAIEEYASNELLGQFLSNTVFRTGILCVILFNSLLIAVETDQELVSAMFYVGPLFCCLNSFLAVISHLTSYCCVLARDCWRHEALLTKLSLPVWPVAWHTLSSGYCSILWGQVNKSYNRFLDVLLVRQEAAILSLKCDILISRFLINGYVKSF